MKYFYTYKFEQYDDGASHYVWKVEDTQEELFRKMVDTFEIADGTDEEHSSLEEITNNYSYVEDFTKYLEGLRKTFAELPDMIEKKPVWDSIIMKHGSFSGASMGSDGFTPEELIRMEATHGLHRLEEIMELREKMKENNLLDEI